MRSRRIEGLPYLPGNAYPDPTLSDFRKTQVFDFVNGFRIPKDDYNGIGNVPIPEKTTSIKDLFEIYNYDPTLTYGKPRDRCRPPIEPPFVTLAKKVLRFGGYYKETMDSPDEKYRVRPVEIYYYLEDDSVMVEEPKVENSGLMQGKFLRRHRIPKNDLGETYNWKDFNLRCEVTFYGRAFRICDCDSFTKEFYDREGIILNDPELIPKDPYTERRFSSLQKRILVSSDSARECLRKFLEYGNKALKFYCVWDDRECGFGGLRKMELIYHLGDDTIQVREIQEPNCGRDPFTLLLHKTKLPKNWKDLPTTFPAFNSKSSEQDNIEYYAPKDFKIGATIIVFGRPFLIVNMDESTKQFYRERYGLTDFKPICMDVKQPAPPEVIPPPWNGWGSPAPEDSLQSWLHIVPVKPRYDITKRLIFEFKVLKYGAILDSTSPEDEGREFTISCRLSDDKIAVFEIPIRNSGWPGGKYLDFFKIIKPGSSKSNPEYYGRNDLYIGAMVNFYGHRFFIKSADPFVLDFIKANPHMFDEQVRQNIQEYFDCQQRHRSGSGSGGSQGKSCDAEKLVCETPVGEGFFEYLGLEAQKPECDPCAENPNPHPMAYNWNRCRSAYDCRTHTPEQGRDLIEPRGQSCDSNCAGNSNMFEPKQRQVAAAPPKKCRASVL